RPRERPEAHRVPAGRPGVGPDLLGPGPWVVAAGGRRHCPRYCLGPSPRRPQGDRRPESVLLGAVPADGSARRPVAVAGVDSPPVTLGVIDHEWRLTEVSADATAVLGWQRDEYRGKSLQAAVHPGDVPALL